jgi:hypothetical protein
MIRWTLLLILILLLFTDKSSIVVVADDTVATTYSNITYYPVNWDLVPDKPPNSPNEQNRKFGSCVCKRLTNECNPNCCCDPDCSTLDLQTFTMCLDETSRQEEDFKCVPEKVVYYSNLPTNIKKKEDDQLSTPTPLFCVYYESSMLLNNTSGNIV